MKVLNLPLGKTKIDISAEKLQSLFASGLEMKQVARELRMDYSVLSRKINESLGLMRAREKGKRIFNGG